jgi:hypothetical protein
VQIPLDERGCGKASYEQRDEHSCTDRPSDDSPKGDAENPKPQRVEWRKVDEAVIFPVVSPLSLGRSYLSKDSYTVFNGQRHADLVHRYEDCLAGTN